MSSSIDITGITTNRKCGEIVITMKKNAKYVYSFNCWFCDTICIQMKKFTMHLEREHEKQLKQNSVDEIVRPEVCEGKLEVCGYNDGVFMPEIKVEDCLPEEIKYEENEVLADIVEQGGYHANANLTQKVLPVSFLDPLETLHRIDDKSKLPHIEHDEGAENSKTNLETTSTAEEDHETLKGDVGMDSGSDEGNDNENLKDNSDYSDTESSSSTDYKLDVSADEDRKTRKSKHKFSEAQEKKFTVALINGFKMLPELWDTSQPEKCNVKRKDELLQSITDNLNSQLKMNLKLYTIKKKLSSLCKEFETEVKNEITEDKSRDSYTSKLWYYDKMEFLKSLTEQKLKHKRKKPNHRVKPLSDSVLIDLIDIYKNYNSLWDVNHLAYTIKEKRHEAMEAMLDEIKTKMNLALDIYKLEKHLAHIHKSFAKEKKIKLDCERKQQDFKPLCSYYRNCDFLEAHQGPFRCCVCSETIGTYNDYQIHKASHSGSMPFQCQECGMGFKKISNFTIHAKRHLRVFKFHCEICGKGYPFNAELDLHMRSHTGAQPYLCSKCGEGFRTAISYDNHIRRHEERFKYFCHICKKGFNHMTRLNDHVKAHLNVRDVICTVCGKGFTSRKYLNHHKRIHEGKNYNCNICGKSFAQDAGLRAHKKYHGTPIGVSSIQKEQNKYNL